MVKQEASPEAYYRKLGFLLHVFYNDNNVLAQWESMISVLLLFFKFLHISQSLVLNPSEIDNWVYEFSTQREVWATKISGDLLHIPSMQFIRGLISIGSFVSIYTSPDNYCVVYAL